MKQLILVVLLVPFVIGSSGIVKAQNKENIYFNKFVGLQFSIPDGWYIATNSQTKELMPDAARIMGLDDPSAKSIVSQMPGKVLLIVTEHPINGDTQRASRNIIFAAISLKEIENEVRSGEEYLAQVSKGIMEKVPNAKATDIYTRFLGGKEFHGLGVELPIQDMTAYMYQFARINNEYLVILNITDDSDSKLTELVGITDANIRLTDVPESVNSSPEGISFRKQCSLNVPSSTSKNSSSGNLLKKMGILLIIFGVFSMFRNFFGQKK